MGELSAYMREQAMRVPYETVASHKCPHLEFQTPTLKLPLIYQMVPARHLRTQCQLGGELLPLKSGNQDGKESAKELVRNNHRRCYAESGEHYSTIAA